MNVVSAYHMPVTCGDKAVNKTFLLESYHSGMGRSSQYPGNKAKMFRTLHRAISYLQSRKKSQYHFHSQESSSYSCSKGVGSEAQVLIVLKSFCCQRIKTIINDKNQYPTKIIFYMHPIPSMLNKKYLLKWNKVSISSSEQRCPITEYSYIGRIKLNICPLKTTSHK